MTHERRHRLLLRGADDIFDGDGYKSLVHIGELDLLFGKSGQAQFDYLIVGPDERGTGGANNLTNYTVFNRPAPGKAIEFLDDDLPLTPHELCLLYQALEEIK